MLVPVGGLETLPTTLAPRSGEDGYRKRGVLDLDSSVLNHEVSAFAACPLPLVLSLSLYDRLTRVVQTTSSPSLFAGSIVTAEQRGTNQGSRRDQEILEEGGGAGPSLLPRRDRE